MNVFYGWKGRGWRASRNFLKNFRQTHTYTRASIHKDRRSATYYFVYAVFDSICNSILNKKNRQLNLTKFKSNGRVEFDQFFRNISFLCWFLIVNLLHRARPWINDFPRRKSWRSFYFKYILKFMTKNVKCILNYFLKNNAKNYYEKEVLFGTKFSMARHCYDWFLLGMERKYGSKSYGNVTDGFRKYKYGLLQILYEIWISTRTSAATKSLQKGGQPVLRWQPGTLVHRQVATLLMAVSHLVRVWYYHRLYEIYIHIICDITSLWLVVSSRCTKL